MPIAAREKLVGQRFTTVQLSRVCLGCASGVSTENSRRACHTGGDLNGDLFSECGQCPADVQCNPASDGYKIWLQIREETRLVRKLLPLSTPTRSVPFRHSPFTKPPFKLV